MTTLGVKFATRSGGHQQNVGFSSIKDGVVLDLSRLNSSSLSKDHKTVRLGTGNRWGEVYKGLEKYGLAAVGGRSGDVGVGGLILGGRLMYQCTSTTLANRAQLESRSSPPNTALPVTMSSSLKSCWPIRPSSTPLPTPIPTSSRPSKVVDPTMAL